nr:MAG TPA: hypothetical protein [Caudoviricetes sp.]
MYQDNDQDQLDFTSSNTDKEIQEKHIANVLLVDSLKTEAEFLKKIENLSSNNRILEYKIYHSLAKILLAYDEKTYSEFRVMMSNIPIRYRFTDIVKLDTVQSLVLRLSDSYNGFVKVLTDLLILLRVEAGDELDEVLYSIDRTLKTEDINQETEYDTYRKLLDEYPFLKMILAILFTTDLSLLDKVESLMISKAPASNESKRST